MNEVTRDIVLRRHMEGPIVSPIVHVCIRGLVPFIQIVGLYVYFHGHYSPGGGFQGGVLMAASIILLRMSLGLADSQAVMPNRLPIPLAAVGALIYAGTGLFAMVAGGSYLDYGFLPIPGLEPAMLRNLGILMIELGVTLCVMSTIISIYDNLLGS
ncbi:MAG: Na(+)/H(+) antiporter subunit B [Desulfobacterales bacterium]|jgi:multicomponent Na+:H+ antiporter subunit B|nr:Na(+)/H(+) antiporter subunit B [Desulfobacterales bacterium]